MASRGMMSHTLAGHDPLFSGGQALLVHEKSRVPTQQEILTRGHSVPTTWGSITSVVPTNTHVAPPKRKRAHKPAPQFPKHRWSN